MQKIQNRLLVQNKNWLAVVCGPTGSGKSYSAISLAMAIDRTFTVEERVVFTPQQFMACLNSGKLKTGMAIVFDEAGVGIPSREWYSISNKLLNYVIQTFRDDNLAVIFTVPSFDFIDLNLRKLFHSYVQTESIDRHRNRCRVRFMDLSYSPQIGKIYFMYPRIPDGEGSYRVMTGMYIKKPPVRMCNQYDKIRKMYSSQLKEGTEEKLSPVAEKKTKAEMVLDLFEQGKTIEDIALKLRMSYQLVRSYIPPSMRPIRRKRLPEKFMNRNVDKDYKDY